MRLLSGRFQERISVVRTEFWMSFAGLVILVAGLITVRKGLASAPTFAKLIALGPVFVAAPLATFAAEHFLFPSGIANGVPTWLPDHLFWVYFVACALIAASISLAFEVQLRWSAPLLALLFLLFVTTIHLPNVIHTPHDRIRWSVMLRDSCFAMGALALTGITLQQKNPAASKILIHIARTIIAIALVFFGLEHFLHPEFAPGVPLPKLMPQHVPFRLFWADLVGAILLVAGIALLINKRTRLCAAIVGLTMALLTLILFTPIMFSEWGTPQVVEGINYVADTLLYAGSILLLAAAMPEMKRFAPSQTVTASS